MLEYERLIGGIEERIRLMTRGRLYRRMRKGDFAPHTHSSELFDKSPDNLTAGDQAGQFGRASFFPGGEFRDERPTVHNHRSRRTAKVDGYISPVHDTLGFGTKNYQVPQSNTPLTHSRMSVARSPVAGTPNLDADRIGEVVGMVVPSVMSYVKHYLRENSLENEHRRMHDRIKDKQNQEIARSLDQSPHRNTSMSHEHKRSGSFGTRNGIKTPCSACSGVKERLSALEQALQLNNLRIDNPYQEKIGFESQFVATTPKGFSERLKKPTAGSNKRSKGEKVSTEKKSVIHSLSSRSQSRKSLAQNEKDISTPIGLKSSMVSPTNAGNQVARTKKKKVSLKLPSPNKLSREGSRTNKTAKSRESKSTDSQISKSNKKPKRLKLKSRGSLELSALSKSTKQSKLSKSIEKSSKPQRESKKLSKAIKTQAKASKTLKKSDRSLSIATSHKTEQSKTRAPKPKKAAAEKPPKGQPSRAASISAATPSGRPSAPARSLLLDSRLPASVKSAFTPKALEYSALGRAAHTGKKKGLQMSGLAPESGIVQRLKTISSRMGSAVETPMSRSDWKR